MDSDDVKITKKTKDIEPKSNKKIKLDSGSEKLSFEEKLKSNIDESRSLCDVKEKNSNDIVDVPTVYKHNKLEWLKPENIRDANKRKPSDPNYDPTTLYVPDEYLNSLTPVRCSNHGSVEWNIIIKSF